MSATSTSPEIAGLEIPIDTWTAPFWEATGEQRLTFPRCNNCGTFRWPPGPFCPVCSAQGVEWCEGGEGEVYSFTVVRTPAADQPGGEEVNVAALIEFPEAGSIRLLAALVDADPSDIRIGEPVTVAWRAAANAVVPVFRLARSA